VQASPFDPKKCHVFLSHPGEIKREFVDFVYSYLKKESECNGWELNVFLDEHSLALASKLTAWSCMETAASHTKIGG
jgi:hypothetical protein